MVNNVPAACSKAEIALGPRFQAETYLIDEEAAFLVWFIGPDSASLGPISKRQSTASSPVISSCAAWLKSTGETMLASQ